MLQDINDYLQGRVRNILPVQVKAVAQIDGSVKAKSGRWLRVSMAEADLLRWSLGQADLLGFSANMSEDMCHRVLLGFALLCSHRVLRFTPMMSG